VEKSNQLVENYFLSVESLWNLWGKAGAKIRNIKFVKIPNLSGFDPLFRGGDRPFHNQNSSTINKDISETDHPPQN
jgi:hypothetical protein